MQRSHVTSWHVTFDLYIIYIIIHFLSNKKGKLGCPYEVADPYAFFQHDVAHQNLDEIKGLDHDVQMDYADIGVVGEEEGDWPANHPHVGRIE